MSRGLRVGFSLVALAGSVAAQAPAHRFSAERARRIGQFLDAEVAANHMAGAVALILQNGRPVYQHTTGWSDKEAGRKMTPDAIFRIASQTKAITSTAVLALVEDGKLGLGDNVSEYLPSFAAARVRAAPNGAAADTPVQRPITVRDLLTHTAGISYGTDSLVASDYAAKNLGPAAGFGWYTADKSEPICESMDRLGTLPFVKQPGEAFVYGYNTDILGCIVERVSGLPLDRFIAARITGPLGLRDTKFYLPAEQRNRLAAVYASPAGGTITRAPDGPKGQGNYVDGPRRSFAGGAGLLSTAGDYARFLQMILDGGELNGVRILSPKTVALMTHNQIAPLALGPGMGFGLGFSTVERVGGDGLASVGTFGWGGAYATNYAVDPSERLVIVLMTQLLPNGHPKIRERFMALVYQSLLGPADR